VIQARNSAVSAERSGDPAQMGAAEGALGAALGRLIALSEAYPDLKANANFQQLQNELTDIENKLAAARRFFNSAVAEYNTGREQFPAVLVANSFGFAPRVFFDLGEERAAVQDAPKVSFN
jgi:LemA protein